MPTPFLQNIAQISRLDGEIFKSAHAYINQGQLGVSLWLDGDQYDTATAALKECGWHCIESKENESAWRQAKDGSGYCLWLQKDVIYPPQKES